MKEQNTQRRKDSRSLSISWKIKKVWCQFTSFRCNSYVIPNTISFLIYWFTHIVMIANEKGYIYIYIFILNFKNQNQIRKQQLINKMHIFIVISKMSSKIYDNYHINITSKFHVGNKTSWIRSQTRTWNALLYVCALLSSY